jgi:hypothetical protein
MVSPNARSIQAQPQRYRFTYTDSIRRRALERLYERRSAVEQLIESLERYQRDAQRANCVEITAARK